MIKFNFGETEQPFSELILLKVNQWRAADRVSLETVMPPMLGKESLYD